MSSAALADIIGRQNLDNLRKPTGRARGFPGVAYTSEELLRLENEKLFSRVWVHAGFAHELANPGDATLATVAGRPLILVCGSDRAIRAFYNSCPHRGVQVCKRNARKRKHFICPYHTWKFDIDGHLLETPNFDGHGDHRVVGHKRDGLGLHPVRCDVWHKWVFVNLDGKAPPLTDYMKPFTDRLRGDEAGIRAGAQGGDRFLRAHLQGGQDHPRSPPGGPPGGARRRHLCRDLGGHGASFPTPRDRLPDVAKAALNGPRPPLP